MKLEVGMYVRTDEGIAKAIEKRKNPYGEETIFIIDKPYMYHFADFLRTAEDLIDINFEEDTSQIQKARHNIIDLIEVGDYVNGNKIIKISTDHCGRNILIYGYDDGDRQVAITIYEDEIKTIVTKEQFESMSYKVGV
jgi:hypothetical protein